MKATPKAGNSGWLMDTLMRDWSTKIVALGLALVVFVVTRDEVTRSYRVPLEVRTDPERVLLTSLPEEVEVELRGPWTKMASVRSSQLGSASLDLREAQPGPLRLDPATIVMPQGVIMSELRYEGVDLRFEDVITRSLTVIPQLSGEVHADYERVSVVVDPPTWAVRGPRSAVERLPSLSTEVLSVDGATEAMNRRLSVLPPVSSVTLSGDVDPAVTIRVKVRARRGDQELKLDLAPQLEAALEEAAPRHLAMELPSPERILVRGSLPAIRALRDIESPFEVEVEVEKLALPRRRSKGVGTAQVRVRIGWGDVVPPEVAKQLDLEPESLRMDLALGPKPRE